MRGCLSLWALILGLPGSVFADNFSFTGIFQNDNDLQQFIFTISNPATVTLQTWSFAGGINGATNTIPAGGFAPVLALFDNLGTIVGNFDQGGTAPGGCGPRNLDAASGLCLDAYLSDSLGAGTYMVVLSQQDNIPLGQNFSDGYQHDGDANFSGGFQDFGYQRNSNWAVDIVTVDSARVVSTVPEPSSVLLLLTGLGWLVSMNRQRKAGS
jgi:hypothetical protein